MEKIKILGSGQTSRLAAIMLSRNFDVEILEEKSKSTQSHFALLRFGSNVIEEITGITLEEVEIKKAIFYNDNIYNESNIIFDNQYSLKTTGKIQRRSIGNLSEGKRYIPPLDFFDKLKERTEQFVEYSADYKKSILDKNQICISTLPMKRNLELCQQSNAIEFDFEKIYVFEMKLENCNIHQTIYFPELDMGQPAYRISIIGNQAKFEISQSSYIEYQIVNSIGEVEFNFGLLVENLLDQFTDAFGIPVNDKEKYDNVIQDILFHGLDEIIKEQKFGKISPIKENLRQEVIFSLTEKFNTYSLGRFSCWRGILLDDVVADVKRIEEIVNYKKKAKDIVLLPGYQRQMIRNKNN